MSRFEHRLGYPPAISWLPGEAKKGPGVTPAYNGGEPYVITAKKAGQTGLICAYQFSNHWRKVDREQTAALDKINGAAQEPRRETEREQSISRAEVTPSAAPPNVRRPQGQERSLAMPVRLRQ